MGINKIENSKTIEKSNKIKFFKSIKLINLKPDLIKSKRKVKMKNIIN